MAENHPALGYVLGLNAMMLKGHSLSGNFLNSKKSV
jgi:hypothetical protein